MPLSLFHACKSADSVWDHSQGFYFPPDRKLSMVFRVLYQPTTNNNQQQHVCLFFLFVCWVNKTRAVKPLRHFHSWRLSSTQDGLAFSTKTARRALCLFVCLLGEWTPSSIEFKLCLFVCLFVGRIPEKPYFASCLEGSKTPGNDRTRNQHFYMRETKTAAQTIYLLAGGSLFVCFFVWVNKTRAVKPLRRFHSWILSLP